MANKRIQLIIGVLLVVAAFLAGSAVAKSRYGEEANLPAGKAGLQSVKGAEATTAPVQPTQPPFVPTKKSSKPEIKFFVMSFCPYGNQAEAGLEAVYQLLKNKATWSPRYIVSQITQETLNQCKDSCPGRVGNEETKKKCQEAIDAKQLTGMDADTCVKQYFPYKTADECIKLQCSPLKAGTFESLHGVQELNQDIREICAYNFGNLDKWWKFVMAVNSKCSAQDADTCWKQQAVDAGLNTNQISSCEKSQIKTLAQKEITEAKKYNASGSPTVLINETLFNGGRSSEDYKKAICSAFENPPAECQKVLGQETPATSGGCN